MPPSNRFPFNGIGFDLIFFDCDSTLSSIEGIDELARQKGKFDEVKRLTDAAMEGEVHLENVYDRRLELLRPTRSEIERLEQKYRQSVVPDASVVIEALQYAGKEVFIISGGLLPAVHPFGQWLGVPTQNIRAVDVRYNSLSGQWWDYQQDRWGQRPDVEYLDPEETPLIESHGKVDVIQELRRGRSGRAVLIGDGISDLVARAAVEKVIGFGGVVTRRRVAAEADAFIKVNSLAPVLPLVLPPEDQAVLTDTPYETTFNKGVVMIEADQVTFRTTE